jgi:hypothetical protein
MVGPDNASPVEQASTMGHPQRDISDGTSGPGRWEHDPGSAWTGRGTTGRDACSLRPVDQDRRVDEAAAARRGPLSRGGEVPALTDLSIS